MVSLLMPLHAQEIVQGKAHPYQGCDEPRSVVKGILFVKIDTSVVLPFRNICSWHGTAAQNRQQLTGLALGIKQNLDNIGISHVRYRLDIPNTPIANKFIFTFDTLLNVDSVKGLIEQLPFVEKVFYSMQYYPSTPFHGDCFDYDDASYILDPYFTASGGWINTTGIYRDMDMSFVEAWEFTKGDANVKIAVNGGGPIMDDPSTGAPDLFGKVLTGYDYNFGTVVTNSVQGYPNEAILHGTTCAKIVAGAHDTSPLDADKAYKNGGMGIAPDCKVVPYITVTSNAQIVSAIYDAAGDKNADFFVTTMTLFDDDCRDAAEDAFNAYGMITIHSYGNSPFIDPDIPYEGAGNFASQHGISVAANIGYEKSPRTRYI